MKSIDARLDEIERSSARVAYQLTVSLKATTSSGYLKDEIRIMTKDPESPSVPVQITAQIQGTLTASPSVLAMGRATVEGAKGRYLIRSSRPFSIRSLEGSGDGFAISADDVKSKTMHVLTVTYDPRNSNIRGDLRRTFRIVTDLADEAPLELNATLRADP